MLYGNFIVYSFIAIMILAVLMIYGLVILTKNKEKLDKNEKLDEFTTNFYVNELDRIISYKTVWYIDSAIGKRFSNTNSINMEVENSEVLEAHENIIKSIIDTLSPRMRLYLIKLYGETWLSDYIRVRTMSLVLNYTKLNIEKLTIEEFVSNQ